MANTVREPETFLHHHRWLAIPLWIAGVAVVGWGALMLLMGAYMATANGSHPWDGPLLSTALYLFYAALPVSLLHLVLVLVGHRARYGSRIAGVLLLILLAVAFGAILVSADLEPM
ncbi:hypothetical protein [Nocardiopsis halotolerans]|uniref:hypothetical protein n=1 Tax=Nocardiopsis halotolerans TaxID=124252 RepID=UPI000378A012|nr:hypothetical protein [Nocardiopsis halotolerans]